MNWEKLCPDLNFTAENKLGKLHKAGHILTLTWLTYSISSSCKNLLMNWVKYMFSIGKNEILNPLEILLIPQGFDLWKGPANSLTPSFPKLIMQMSTQTDNHKYRKVLQLKKVLL